MGKLDKIVRALPLAPVIGCMYGASAAALVAATPPDLLAVAVRRTGLSLLLGAPPYGVGARLVAVVFGFVAVALIVGALVATIVYLLNRPARVRTEPIMADHDEPADNMPRLGGRRRPISADRELGAPLMSDAALTTNVPDAAPGVIAPETVLDAKELLLDMPVAEPLPLMVAEEAEPTGSTLSVQAPVDTRADADLHALLAPEEFGLPPSPDDAQQVGESTIDALIRRLAAGMARRTDGEGPPDPASRATQANPDPHRWMVREDNRNSDFDDDTTRAIGTLRAFASR